MSLAKIETVKFVEVFEDNAIQVCIATRIIEDNKQISESLRQYVIAPGDDYSEENAKVKAICATVHTTEVVETYQAAQSA
jgi:hypothetical protein